MNEGGRPAINGKAEGRRPLNRTWLRIQGPLTGRRSIAQGLQPWAVAVEHESDIWPALQVVLFDAVDVMQFMSGDVICCRTDTHDFAARHPSSL